MYIFLATGHTLGSQRWRATRHPINDNDEPGGATPIAIDEPSGDDREAIDESGHRPWLVPGVGTAF